MILRTKTWSFAIFLCLFSGYLTYGQQIIRRNMNIMHGLSNNTINAIVQDKYGFIWIGTKEGLNRFDGKEFKVYKNIYKEEHTSGVNQIIALAFDLDDNLWVSCKENGVYKYEIEQNRFTKIDLDKYKFPTTYIRTITCDSQGNIWLGSNNSMFAKFEKTSQSWSTASLAENDTAEHIIPILKMREDVDGDIWLATSNGTYVVDSKSLNYQRIEVPLQDNWLNDILVSSDGNTYFFSTKSFVRCNKSGHFESKEILFLTPKKHFIPESILEVGGNTILISSNLGLFEIKKDELNFEDDSPLEMEVKDNLNFPIKMLYLDSFENIWVGGWHNGITFFNSTYLFNSFHFYKPEVVGEDPQNSVIRTMSSLGDDIWMGTDWNGIYSLNLKTGATKHFLNNKDDPNSIAANIIKCMYKPSEEELWIGSYGLVKYNARNQKFKYYRIDANSSRDIGVVDIVPFEKNKLLLATGGYLAIFDMKLEKVVNKIYLPQFTGRFIVCMEKQNDNSYWIGTDYGIYLYEKNKNQFRTYRNNKDDQTSLSHNFVQCFRTDSKGRLWIGTASGLNVYNPISDNFLTLDKSMGLPSNSVLSMEEDEDGNLWCSTNKGIFRINLAKISFSKEAIKEIPMYIDNFNTNHGLQNSQFYPRSVNKLEDGTLLFGAMNGINYFQPSQVNKKEQGLHLAFSDFKVLNESLEVQPEGEESILKQDINSTKKIVLDHDQSFVSVDYLAFNYQFPESVLYAYRLLGLEDDWQYVGNKTHADFNYLPPGKYTFQVKATLENKNWETDPIEISIEIMPPWYATIAFRLIYIVAIFVAIYLFIMIRTSTLRKHQKHLEAVVKSRTEELEGKNEKLKEQAEHLENKNKEIIAITEKLHQADQMKLRFFTDISHELKTPLTLILGPLQSLLSSKDLDLNAVKKLNAIKKNASRLLSLLNQIMEFRKIESNMVELQLEKGDVVACAKAVYDSFYEESLKKNISFEFESDQKVIGTFDQDKIEKILFNLLSNAFKFTKEHESITLKIVFIESMAASEEDKVVMVVEDTGIGIPEDELAQVFERFYTKNETKETGAIIGSGIGLALVKKLTEILNGTIKVESKLGEGTRFTVTIPLAVQGKRFSQNVLVNGYGDVNLDDTQVEPKIEITNKGAKILVVEDDEDLLEFLENELSEHFNVVSATNGSEGIDKATTELPDLVISDVMMPVLDGISMCDQLKQGWQTGHIPVVLLTARGKLNEKIIGLETGADAYIQKPFDLKYLLKYVDNILNNRKSLLQKFQQFEFDPGLVYVNSADNEFVHEIFEKINENISNNMFSVDTLADEMNMSRSKLYKKVLKITGNTIGALIREARLKRSAELLKSGRYNISEVATMVGFNDRPQFARSFKNFFGVNPKKFQETELATQG